MALIHLGELDVNTIKYEIIASVEHVSEDHPLEDELSNCQSVTSFYHTMYDHYTHLKLILQKAKENNIDLNNKKEKNKLISKTLLGGYIEKYHIKDTISYFDIDRSAEICNTAELPYFFSRFNINSTDFIINKNKIYYFNLDTRCYDITSPYIYWYQFIFNFYDIYEELRKSYKCNDYDDNFISNNFEIIASDYNKLHNDLLRSIGKKSRDTISSFDVSVRDSLSNWLREFSTQSNLLDTNYRNNLILLNSSISQMHENTEFICRLYFKSVKLEIPKYNQYSLRNKLKNDVSNGEFDKNSH